MTELLRRQMLLIHQDSNHYRVQSDQAPDQSGRMILEAARAAGAQVRSYQVATRSLEDAFLEAIR